MKIAAHVAQHGKGTCDRFTGTVFDVLVYCPKCENPMEHHCCHLCCLDCGIDQRGFTTTDCVHEKRREIAEPQRNVENKRLIELRVWFCPDCGQKWETRQGLGDVTGITLSVELGDR